MHLKKKQLELQKLLSTDKIKQTENGESVLSGICRHYVLAKLYSSLAFDDYIDLGNDYMLSFRTTLRNLKDAQLEDGIEGDESKKARNLFIRQVMMWKYHQDLAKSNLTALTWEKL